LFLDINAALRGKTPLFFKKAKSVIVLLTKKWGLLC